MAAASGLERFMMSELECPVCLLIPREGPVGACPVGHIVCKRCQMNVERCPTCRRPMFKDATNTIVNKMIGEVPHPCKYSRFGCEIKQRLNELMAHEAKCQERTIKCPHLKCNEEVQLKKYHEHALASKKCYRYSISNKLPCTTYNLDNGESIQTKLSRFHHWPMRAIKSGRGKHVSYVVKVEVKEAEHVKMCVDCQRYFVNNDSLQKHLQEVHKLPGPTNDVSINSSSSSSKKKREDMFYLHQYYFSTEKTFAFYVTSEGEKYLAKITLKNYNDERKFLTNVQSVVSMDSAPRNRDEVLASKNVMFVPWRQMSGFLKWIEKDGKQSSIIKTTVDIIDE